MDCAAAEKRTCNLQQIYSSVGISSSFSRSEWGACKMTPDAATPEEDKTCPDGGDQQEKQNGQEGKRSGMSDGGGGRRRRRREEVCLAAETLATKTVLERNNNNKTEKC